MRFLFQIVLVGCLCGGCFSSRPKRESRYWTVECPASEALSGSALQAKEATPPQTVRLGAVSVLAPWDGSNIMVRRVDGSVARDPYNLFAAQPAALLKAPLLALAGREGAFGRVLSSATAASPDSILEVTVSDFSLDCTSDVRRASVALTATLVAASGRKVIAEGAGEAKADATSGDYSAAFSEAFAAAVKSAFAKMR